MKNLPTARLVRDTIAGLAPQGVRVQAPDRMELASVATVASGVPAADRKVTHSPHGELHGTARHAGRQDSSIAQEHS